MQKRVTFPQKARTGGGSYLVPSFPKRPPPPVTCCDVSQHGIMYRCIVWKLVMLMATLGTLRNRTRFSSVLTFVSQ